MLASVSYPVVRYFSTLTKKKKHDCRANFIEHKTCILIFSINFSETLLIVKNSKRDIVITANRSSCEVPIIFVSL